MASPPKLLFYASWLISFKSSYTYSIMFFSTSISLEIAYLFSHWHELCNITNIDQGCLRSSYSETRFCATNKKSCADAKSATCNVNMFLLYRQRQNKSSLFNDWKIVFKIPNTKHWNRTKFVIYLYLSNDSCVRETCKYCSVQWP